MQIKKFKKLTAFVICVMLVLSMCVTGFNASAATSVEETASAVNEEVVSDVEETTVTTEPVTTANTEATVVTEPTENKTVTEPVEATTVVSEPAEEEYITVFFCKDQHYYDENGYYREWDEVYAYYWNETEGDMIDAPGVAMSTYGGDEYSYTMEMVVSIPATAKYITFHDNNGHEVANLAIEGDGMIYRDGQWQNMTRTVGFDNRVTDWDNVYAYYWSETDGSIVQWPGVEMTESDGYYYEWIYTEVVPLNATHIIFHNNEGSQTSEMAIIDGIRVVFSSFANEWMSDEGAVQCATAEADICMVAGDSELCGTDWDGDLSTSYHNTMDKLSDEYEDYGYDENGYYRCLTEFEKVYEDVEPATGLQIKVVDHFIDAHHTYTDEVDDIATWHGNENDNRVTFNVTKTCDVKIHFDFATGAITVTGDGVVMVDDLNMVDVYAIGNGKGNWLNGSNWNTYEPSNKMTEIEHNVYQISYYDVAPDDFYELKFMVDTGDGPTWDYNWGGVYEGSGVDTEAVHNANPITFENPYDIADITLTIDFNTYNPATKTGAKFNVYIDDKTTSTLRFVLPKTANSSKCWDNGVYLAYSNDYTPSSFTKLALTKTQDAVTPELMTENLIDGTYIVYSIYLTTEQVEAVNNAKYVAVMNSSNDYRTYASGKYNILKAPVGEYAEEYSTTKTDVVDLDGYTFIMNDEVETGTSIQGYATFTGFWKNVDFKEEQITIKAVLPASVIWNNCWKNGVYLAYSDNYEVDSFTKIEMTKTDETYWPGVNTDYFVDDDCYIYTVTLTGEQAVAIENSDYVVFMNDSNDYRTYINKNYNIFNASLWYVEYVTEKAPIASFDDYIFVVCNGVATGTSIEGYGTFTGYWIDWYY